MKCNCWREHSKDYPRGVKAPKTIESLQAAWDRDQELIFQQKEEISRLKQKLNNQVEIRLGDPSYDVMFDIFMKAKEDKE